MREGIPMTSDGLTAPTGARTQILFGHLPGQTIDMHGGVWKVDSWRNPRFIRVDSTALRKELARLARPWSMKDNDGGFVRRVEAATASEYRASISGTVSPSHDSLRPSSAGCAIASLSVAQRSVSAALSWGQLHFVGYHTCGEIDRTLDPALHNSRSGQSRLSRVIRCPPDQICLPCLLGRTPARLRLQSLPVWPRQHVLQRSPSSGRFHSAKFCDCQCDVTREGGSDPRRRWWLNVRSPGLARACQKAAWRMFWSISTPWSKTWLPEASRARRRRRWLASGLRERSLPQHPLRACRRAAQYSMRRSRSSQRYQGQRTTPTDLIERTSDDEPLGLRYRSRYLLSIHRAGLESVELIDRFPVLTGHFGYALGSRAGNVTAADMARRTNSAAGRVRRPPTNGGALRSLGAAKFVPG